MTESNLPAVDAVVTWVDNSDPIWLEALTKYAAGAGAAASGRRDPASEGPRYRDGGFLRYCLRGIDRHLPWIRRIHLVTAGHRPAFLDLDCPRIQCVSHADIFPCTEDLPTFNSMAIEAHLHRIAGLTDQFVYFNDDVFVLAPMARSHFVTGSGGHVLPFEDFPLPMDLAAADSAERSLAFTHLTLSARFGPNRARHLVAHVPQVYDRRWIMHLWSVWGEEFRRTSSKRWRTTDSVALRALYYHSIREIPTAERPHFARRADYPALCLAAPTYRFLWTRSSVADLKAGLGEVDRGSTAFLCINDDETDPAAADAKLSLARRWLDDWLPGKAPWECA